MLIECTRCGAPLDVPTGAKIARCNYCRSSHYVQATRTLAAQTPSDWRPPTTWTPAQHGPQPAQPLKYHRSNAWVFVLIVAGATFAVVVAVVGFFVARAASSPQAASRVESVQAGGNVPA